MYLFTGVKYIQTLLGPLPTDRVEETLQAFTARRRRERKNKPKKPEENQPSITDFLKVVKTEKNVAVTTLIDADSTTVENTEIKTEELLMKEESLKTEYPLKEEYIIKEEYLKDEIKDEEPDIALVKNSPSPPVQTRSKSPEQMAVNLSCHASGPTQMKLPPAPSRVHFYDDPRNILRPPVIPPQLHPLPRRSALVGNMDSNYGPLNYTSSLQSNIAAIDVTHAHVEEGNMTHDANKEVEESLLEQNESKSEIGETISEASESKHDNESIASSANEERINFLVAEVEKLKCIVEAYEKKSTVDSAKEHKEQDDRVEQLNAKLNKLQEEIKEKDKRHKEAEKEFATVFERGFNMGKKQIKRQVRKISKKKTFHKYPKLRTSKVPTSTVSVNPENYVPDKTGSDVPITLHSVEITTGNDDHSYDVNSSAQDNNTDKVNSSSPKPETSSLANIPDNTENNHTLQNSNNNGVQDLTVAQQYSNTMQCYVPVQSTNGQQTNGAQHYIWYQDPQTGNGQYYSIENSAAALAYHGPDGNIYKFHGGSGETAETTDSVNTASKPELSGIPANYTCVQAVDDSSLATMPTQDMHNLPTQKVGTSQTQDIYGDDELQKTSLEVEKRSDEIDGNLPASFREKLASPQSYFLGLSPKSSGDDVFAQEISGNSITKDGAAQKLLQRKKFTSVELNSQIEKAMNDEASSFSFGLLEGDDIEDGIFSNNHDDDNTMKEDPQKGDSDVSENLGEEVMEISLDEDKESKKEDVLEDPLNKSSETPFEGLPANVPVVKLADVSTATDTDRSSPALDETATNLLQVGVKSKKTLNSVGFKLQTQPSKNAKRESGYLSAGSESDEGSPVVVSRKKKRQTLKIDDEETSDSEHKSKKQRTDEANENGTMMNSASENKGRTKNKGKPLQVAITKKASNDTKATTKKRGVEEEPLIRKKDQKEEEKEESNDDIDRESVSSSNSASDGESEKEKSEKADLFFPGLSKILKKNGSFPKYDSSKKTAERYEATEMNKTVYYDDFYSGKLF